MIIKPKIHGANIVSPAINSTHSIISRNGPGVFVAASIFKMGGANDTTSIQIKIDSTPIVSVSYQGADATGFDIDNTSGIKLLKGSPDTLTVQFNEPIYFQTKFEITAFIATDAGINQISTQVLLAENCKYPV